MILVDTSVWVDHFRNPEPGLRKLLNAGDVLMHAMIVGEIACGNVPNQAEVLQKMNHLPAIDESSHAEVLSMIGSKSLMRRGIGYIDAHLICSVLNCEGVTLWTRDRRLRQVAEALGIACLLSAYGKG